ncbi:MAG: HupE/UreJ family protein, partial [Verrucomicrobiota bacterium]
FFLLGVHHIWTGYDHLLFLFALLIVCDSFASIGKIVTCFTLAHSLTLALATLNIVQIRSSVIEPTIAASIVYVGLENIFHHGHPKGRWLLTFAFGLVHGFGFASVLREMDIAKAGSVIVPLVSFNLGVEAGQIAVAAVILPLIWRLKKTPSFAPRWVPVCSILVAAAGAYWFIERVWF